MSAGVEVDLDSAVVAYRLADGVAVSQAARSVLLEPLFEAHPWRTFRWYAGQRHYSGSYWAATEGAHVIYESRLELSELLMADFDLTVAGIKAQPFLLRALVNGRVRRHVPDYLLRRDCGTVVVGDVVRGERLEDPKVQRLCAWTRRLVESLSWEYRVVCEQPPVLLNNVRFLAGYRRGWLINGDAVAQIRSCREELVGRRIDDAERRLGKSVPGPSARSVLMHALWRQELHVDLTLPLRPSTILEERW